MPKSALPFGSEFSPGRKVVLTELLKILDQHRGDRAAFLRAVYERFWSKKQDGASRAYGSGKGKEADGDGQSLAQNTLLALQAYGIVEKPPTGERGSGPNPTTFGESLIAAAGDEAKALGLLAAQILTSLNGMTLLQAAGDLKRGGNPATIPDIAKHLHKAHGLYVSPGSTVINTMRQWLQAAGVVDKEWNADPNRIKALIGAAPNDVEAMQELDDVQIAFARALSQLGNGEFPANQVAAHAQRVFGVEFPVKSLPSSVLDPLERAGLLISTKTTKGRGAKPHTVKPTALLRQKYADPLLEQLAGSIGKTLRAVVRRPFAEILDELDLPVDETHRRGLALEALAVKIMFTLGLTFVGWRRRDSRTSQAEVDVIVESARLIFSRWQIQCKATSKVSEDEVAKEIGLAFRLKSNVIVMVTTGTFTAGAKLYARDIMADTNYQIVLLDGGHLKALRADPTAISEQLTQQAEAAMAIKRESLPLDK